VEGVTSVFAEKSIISVSNDDYFSPVTSRKSLVSLVAPISVTAAPATGADWSERLSGVRDTKDDGGRMSAAAAAAIAAVRSASPDLPISAPAVSAASTTAAGPLSSSPIGTRELQQQQPQKQKQQAPQPDAATVAYNNATEEVRRKMHPVYDFVRIS
jgi:hypothetical protein